MYMFRHRGGVLGFAVVITLLLSIMVVPDVLAAAANPIFETQALNDRFASLDGKGGDGFAKVRTVQQGSLVFDSVIAKNLEPNTTYQVHVVAGAVGPFTQAGIVAAKIVDATTNGGGVLHVRDIDLEFGIPDTYRVDVLVTQDGYVPGSIIGLDELDMVALALNLDVLLACQPAFLVTVVE